MQGSTRESAQPFQSKASPGDWSSFRDAGPARVALYARVSTSEQTQGYSLQEQINELRRYCDRRGGRCVRVLWEAESGGTMDRPRLEWLLQLAEADAYDILLVWKVDRLGRSNVDLQNMWAFFKSLQVDVVSATEPFDSTTAQGKLLFDMSAMLAEWERGMIRERASLGARGRAREGRWHGGSPPHGYAYDSTTGHLRVDDAEAAMIRHIVTLALEHRKLEAVSRTLTNEGVRTRRGLPWQKPTLSRLIRNELYVGILRVRDIVTQDPSLRILDDETFAGLQDLRHELHRHRIARYHRPPGIAVAPQCCTRCGERLFGTMAYCSNCGAAQWTPAPDEPALADVAEKTQAKEEAP